MTDQIKVPRATWDALISALKNHPGNYKLTTLEAKVYQTIITRAEALTAATAVSEQKGLFVDLIASHGPEFAAEMAATEPQAQGDAAKKYAENLCTSMARKFYPEVTQFKPLDDLFGLLTQIDNMTTGLVRPQATEPACKQLLQVPEGYTLVPVNATPEMIAAAEQVEDLYRRGTPDTWGSVYRAMLAAAPEAKQ